MILESYTWLLNKCKENQVKYSRGYAILDRMNETLEIMKQKKKSLLNPKVKQTHFNNLFTQW